MRCIRTVTDTPVADCSAAGPNMTHRVEYRHPIAISTVHIALSVSYFKRTVWRLGQLGPYVGKGSLRIRMHLNCNRMGDIAKISPRIPSTCAHNATLSLLFIHIIPSRQIYVAIDNSLLVPSVYWLTTRGHLWNYVCAADDASHTEHLQSNGCGCFSHLYKFQDGIQVT